VGSVRHNLSDVESMNSRMAEARRIGILIADRISKKGMKFIEEYDPDLHYDLVQARKKK